MHINNCVALAFLVNIFQDRLKSNLSILFFKARTVEVKYITLIRSFNCLSIILHLDKNSTFYHLLLNRTWLGKAYVLPWFQLLGKKWKPPAEDFDSTVQIALIYSMQHGCCKRACVPHRVPKPTQVKRRPFPFLIADNGPDPPGLRGTSCAIRPDLLDTAASEGGAL